MADSAVEITAGTGTNVDTRTEATNGNHRQVMVIGDPSTNAGVAPVDATNGLSVNVTNASLTVASHAVTNAGTFAVQVDGSALTALQKIDDPVFVDDAAFTPGTSSVMMIGAQLDNTGTDSVDEGDAGAVRMSANRNLYVNIRDNAGNERGLSIDANGALANVATATENHLGEVGGKTSVFSVTLSTDTAAYASGDLIADTQQMDAFFRVTNGTGVINAITIIDEDNQGAAFYILFMSTSTSLGTENSAPNISDANLTAGLQGIVSVATTDYITISGTKSACIKNIGLPVKAVSGTDDLYIAVLNSTGTPTYTAAGLEMRIHALLD